ncbi:uncharacterized protein N7459_008928 [Penicillium hispanicum]|uniref:uncharacterized protein n=1 Tax=Penicillium hispanicum TaxID=1080232 RepID=UPI002542417E|nr:uncharacterized protein N7459_008928 [Penicillium hispanicum]KAJ5569498.1 hypothetical protein N7459_008928 [Penicillium hispanicum]
MSVKTPLVGSIIVLWEVGFPRSSRLSCQVEFPPPVLANQIPVIAAAGSQHQSTRSSNAIASLSETSVIFERTCLEFNYAAIIQRYSGILNSQRVASDPIGSPPAAIGDEPRFHARFVELLLPRVRRALRAGFEALTPHLQQLNLVPVTFDDASSAAYIDQHRPDTAFVIVGGNYDTNANRAPGDLKVSWQWRSEYRHSQDPFAREQYADVLSEVNFHIGQHNARHGFVITNAELVAVKRLDANGRLAVSASIPWTAGGQGQLTVLLGLWYLGMLAAKKPTGACSPASVPLMVLF